MVAERGDCLEVVPGRGHVDGELALGVVVGDVGGGVEVDVEEDGGDGAVGDEEESRDRVRPELKDPGETHDDDDGMSMLVV